MFIALAITVLHTAAWAGKCDHLYSGLDSKTGEALTSGFAALAECDQKLAEDHYNEFLGRAEDVETLAGLSRAAITANIWTPVWQQLSKITSYDARDEIARELGAACGDEPKIVSFLQGAYYGLRDIDFQQWDDAFIACPDAALEEWVAGQIQSPPDRLFDDKFNALLNIWVEKKGRDALDILAASAIKAAEAGPYDTILMQMDSAVAPDLGEDMTDDDRAALEKALVSVAQGVDPDKARSVADRLANSGAQAAAAKLLPRVYPDRQQSDGGFMYGAVSMEKGSCKGTKTIVLHHATISEPGKRWILLGEIDEAMRTFKPKLSKCDAEGGDWPVATTPEPVASTKEIDAWVTGLEKQWAEQGYEVKLQGEKDIALP